MVIWIIGKSGSGKTFFARKLEKLFRGKKSFLVDGDEVRKYLNTDLSYSTVDRKINSSRIQKLCLYLEKKNFLVLCSIQSIFTKDQKKNRKIFEDYKQIYLKVDEKIFKKRRSKLYKFKKNIVGKDIKFPEPFRSDLVISNDFKTPLSKLKRMVRLIKKK